MQICAEEICRKAARLVQIKVGQVYQTVQMRDFLNQDYEDLWVKENWKELIVPDSMTVASGRDWFVLPRKYGKLIGGYTTDAIEWVHPLYDELVNAQSELQRLYRGPMTSWAPNRGGVYNAAFIGDQPVLVQPASAEKVKISSAATADTSIPTRITGEDSTGERIEETITTNASNGTTKVESSLTYKKILSFGCGNVSKAGKLTLEGSTSTTVFAVMDTWAGSTAYAKYQIIGTLTEAKDLSYLAKLRFKPFTVSVETPFREDVAMALVYGAAARALMEQRDTDSASAYFQMRQAELGKVRADNKEPGKWLMKRW